MAEAASDREIVPGLNAPKLDVPDFDTYPVRHRPRHAESIPQGVRLVWDDGLESRYHAFWLRENAPDPETTHPVTREQVLQLLEIPGDIDVAEARIDDAGYLIVHWSTDEMSRYHPGWLRAYTHDGGTAEHALPPIRLWEATSPGAVPRFDGPKAMSDAETRDGEFARWTEALHIHGAAILEGLDARPEVIETVPAMLGPIRETNFGPVFDVQSKPNATSNAYTAMALPIHTDLCTREYVPGLQFLHCLKNEAVGGDSVLADGFRIAEDLRHADRRAFDALTTHPITFYNKAVDTDYRFDAPLIELDAAGAVNCVRWSPWLRAPVVASFEVTAEIYHGLRALFRLGEDSKYLVTTKLKVGELLGFDNRRILHGRKEYDPASGERWLRGCYVEREELWSRLRILRRRNRAAERAG